MLHPRYLDIIRAFKREGLRVQSFTNGTLVDEEMAGGLVESGLDVLNVTFWAVNGEEHAYWHPGVSLSYLDRRHRTLERLAAAKDQRKRMNPRVNIQLPLNRNNFSNLKERVNLVLASGCEEMTFGFFRDWGGEFEDRCILPEDVETIREGLLSAKKRFEADGIEHNVDEYLARIRLGADAWRTVPCYAGWYESCVKVDGTVLACCPCSMVMGNLREDPFGEIWNGPAYRDFRRNASRPEGLLSLRDRCNCANCCLWRDNVRVHRTFRWFAPLKSPPASPKDIRNP
jgi:MoaA/NifB/PqqE/SkfB family radical SAM enzyme